jgi:hypothetical protein
MIITIKIIFKLLILSLLLWILSSCSKTFLAAYGIKSPMKLSSDQIIQVGIKYGIPGDDLFILNNDYQKYLDSVGKSHNLDIKQCDSNSIIYKNHLQPLQLLFFDKHGKLISFHNNCYCGGFPNLEWNNNGILDSIPPKTAIPVDSLLNLNSLDKFITSSKIGIVSGIKDADYNYSLVVFWTTFMGRQSENLIKLIHSKYNYLPKNTIRIVFINVDRLFVE